MKKDLISRQKLRMALYHEAFELDSDEQRWDGGCWIRYKMFERVVESMPTESERERGKWEEIETGGMYLVGENERIRVPAKRCSVCGEYIAMQAHANNYCPVCGAEMEEDDD